VPKISAETGLSTRAALLGTVAGTLYGLSATLMKPVVENWHAEAADVVASFEFWVWAAVGDQGRRSSSRRPCSSTARIAQGG
jgi:hypothetical protein